MIKSPDEPLWDTLQTAAYLNLSPRWFRVLRRRGDTPPHVMVGDSYRYVPATVRAWVKARELEQASA
jgi:hypothetical protein